MEQEQPVNINALAILGISIEGYKPPIMKMLGNIEMKQ